MSRRSTAVLILITLTCGVGAFFASRTMAVASDDISDIPHRRWLAGKACDVTDIEDKFGENIRRLSFNIKGQRRQLAEMIDDLDTDPELITQQSETVIVAQENLIRSVGEHIITLRGKLSPEQREYLMGICANSVRGPMRKKHGSGSGQGNRNGRQRRMHFATDSNDAQNTGRGMGSGNGMLCGSGRGRRLAVKLELSQDQIDKVTKMDPEFDSQCKTCCEDIAVKRTELLAAFENEHTSDDDILQKVESLIKVYTALERRVIEHVLIVRPSLTSQQQSTLVGLCGNCPRN